MPVITLPDGSTREYAAPVTGLEVATDIGRRLAEAAVAVRVNGELRDLTASMDSDVAIEIVTRESADGLELLRHDAAHVMAEAVKELYPDTQVTIGPAITDGFYYDFARAEPFTPEDLERIETRMQEIVQRDETITREEWLRDDAVDFFMAQGEAYKAEIISSIPANETISLYRQGEFIDLCRGPHLPSTGRLGTAFKLTKLAGAYWRGDARNPMLQRIYGTAWSDAKQLRGYLQRIEEAERRDHRRIGRQMDLFHLQEEAPGMVFWHPRGWTLYQQIEQYMRHMQATHGYQEIRTPQVVERSLWEKSGHWDKFHEHMFTTASENRDYAIKPMNCPCHVQVFNQGLRSYRDLPLRLAEFGACHRNEPSGALHGIMRVRGFVQDDAHIFCAEDDIQVEVAAFIDFLHEVYAGFGFTDIIYKLSTRPEQRVGSDDIWDKAEKALADALDSAGLDWEELPGEGAFYGPKVEFSLRDCLDRVWQCGTIQVDFSMPGRLGAQYVTERGDRETPVMLHRAVLGSFERFIGILIEHYAGALPLWLAPVQVIVAPITSDVDDYALEVAQLLGSQGLRAETDLRNEKINYKVREHSLAKVPVIIAVGKREMSERTVSVRRLGSKDQSVGGLDEVAAQLVAESAWPSSSGN